MPTAYGTAWALYGLISGALTARDASTSRMGGYPQAMMPFQHPEVMSFAKPT